MEKDLFEPIKEYFEKAGYSCDGEVQDIDLYMEKGDESIAVELKQTLDFRAVQQAALRQKITDTVFIGIFRPRDLNSKSFRDKIYILKRLGIGLIVVSKRTLNVDIVSPPVVSELEGFIRQNKDKKKRLSDEFRRRRAKNNTGGIRGTALITSYREDALLVLDALMELGGTGKAAKIRDLSGIQRARDIMYSNHYGWFSNIGNGIYTVTDIGLDALEEFEDTLKILSR